MTISRRTFLKTAGASVSVALVPLSLRAQSAAGRVVIIGAGLGGGTAAKYLRLWSPGVQVTVIEPAASYYSCILSNTYYPGVVNLDSLQTPYTGLAGRGIEMIRDSAVDVDTGAHRVSLAGGGTVSYDKLVMAPGIDFIFPPGLDQRAVSTRVPHAWKNVREQAPLLRSMLLAMPNGGTFVETVPPMPYRCPPAPYERACMVAAYFRRAKPRSKVVILDANPGIVAKPETFRHAFEVTYEGLIEYHSGVPLVSVNPDDRSVTTSAGTVQADVLNVIPPQRAGDIAFAAGLVTNGRWAGVNPRTFEATAAGDVFVVGDSNGSNAGKSGHFANSEGKLVASAIAAQLAGEPENPTPMLSNVCYSAITLEKASWFTNHMALSGGALIAIPASVAESPPTSDNFEDMFGWARNLWADSLR